MIKRTIRRLIRWSVKSYWRWEYESYRNQYEIASSFKLQGQGIRFHGRGEIIIGENGHIGSYSAFQSAAGRRIVVGRGCHISHNVRIYTRVLNADQDFSQSELSYRGGNVEIGDFVLVGVNTYISPGVTIGENSIVGANSVVTRDVPPNSVAAGVPTRVIRTKAGLCISHN